MKDGILLIDKPADMTSFGVVARIRRVLSSSSYSLGKKVKVGHTGTLDPFATGLMIIVIGNECKNAEKYSKLDKIYEVVIKLGETSTTGDTEGEISKISDKKPTLSDIERIVENFVGEITQRPPLYSAIKIGGQRAYKIAREGKQVEMPERQVKIYGLEILSYEYPDLKIRVHVSSGTYIRSLAEDIGKALGTGAYCTELRRLSVGEWNVQESQKLIEFGIID
ncbi:MAG TPA: tRNA pseudouridine(55) synthase TruB [Candidatus Saccharibacteria bacterium]|nr:tRNA pseudouridine(55) synthase TruB [Candidatus Saccharibacteria bacterium]